MKLIETYLLLLACMVFLFVGCTAKTEAVPIEPCREATTERPVTMECAAAALAEQAFLEATKQSISKYVVFPMQHEKERWYFMIELGDKETPPPPGGHFMVAVDRATGKTELTPGA